MTILSRTLHLTPLLALSLMLVAAETDHGHDHEKAAVGPSSHDLRQRLLDGNQRFVSGTAQHPRQDAATVKANAQGQHPFAAVLGCADSRVGPETIFDQGLGDLFVVRVAGNLSNDQNLGSLEYAVEHLGVRLIVVLGHERCGAVKAALAGGEAPGHLPALMTALAPAVAGAKGTPGDAVDNTVNLNAQLQAKAVAASPILAKAIADGHLTVTAARYDLDTGAVEFLK